MALLQSLSVSLTTVFSVSFLEIGVIGILSITRLLAFNWHLPQDLQKLSISCLVLGISSFRMVNCHQAFSDSLLFCSSSNFFASALCIACSPSSSASSNRLAIGNSLSLTSSSLSSDSNKLSRSHASFSYLILSDVTIITLFVTFIFTISFVFVLFFAINCFYFLS